MIQCKQFKQCFFQPNPHAMVFYEALVLYGEVVMETVQDGIDFRDGLNIVRRLKNRTFDGRGTFLLFSFMPKYLIIINIININILNGLIII